MDGSFVADGRQGFDHGGQFGGLALATFLTLFVVPIIYVMMDRLCLAVTGHSSARGLRRSKEIMAESEKIDREQGPGEPVLAK